MAGQNYRVLRIIVGQAQKAVVVFLHDLHLLALQFPAARFAVLVLILESAFGEAGINFMDLRPHNVRYRLFQPDVINIQSAARVLQNGRYLNIKSIGRNVRFDGQRFPIGVIVHFQ